MGGSFLRAGRVRRRVDEPRYHYKVAHNGMVGGRKTADQHIVRARVVGGGARGGAQHTFTANIRQQKETLLRIINAERWSNLDYLTNDCRNESYISGKNNSSL